MRNFFCSQIEERYIGILEQYFDVVEGYAVRNRLKEMGKTILDLGCGSGRFLPLLTLADKRLIAIDLFMPDLKIAALKNDRSKNKALLIQGDATALPLSQGSIDTVIAMGIFQFSNNLTPFLRELQRVIKLDGKLVFSVWNKPTFNLPVRISIDSDQKQHRADNVENTLRQFGFQVESIECTFFMPRRLFWWGYRLTRGLRVHYPYLIACIWLENALRKSPILKSSGWELLVVAKKGNDNETV